MREHTFQPASIMVADVRGGGAHRVVLIVERHVLVVDDQRIAADRHDRERFRHEPPCLPLAHAARQRLHARR
jgi:hypothetical protein